MKSLDVVNEMPLDILWYKHITNMEILSLTGLSSVAEHIEL